MLRLRPLLFVALLAGIAGCGTSASPPAGTTPTVVHVQPGSILGKDPYLGVSCRTPNRFACDRVGLAVWLKTPARSVVARIDGRLFALDDPSWSGRAVRDRRRLFAGFLQPAGFADGPLRIRPRDGSSYWAGDPPVSARIGLVIRRDHEVQQTSVRVRLSPGWG